MKPGGPGASPPRAGPPAGRVGRRWIGTTTVHVAVLAWVSYQLYAFQHVAGRGARWNGLPLEIDLERGAVTLHPVFSLLVSRFRDDLGAARELFSWHALAENLAAFLLFLLIDAVVFVNGHALCRRLRIPLAGRLTRLVYAHAIGYACLFLLFTIYGLLGLYYGAVAWATLACALLLAVVYATRHGAELRRACPRLSRPGPVNATLLVMVVALLGVTLIAALRPPEAWDEVAYNLWLPRVYIEQNGLPYVEEYNLYSAFPQYAEMSYVAGLLLGFSHRLPRLFNWMYAVLLVLCLCMVGRRFGLRERLYPLLALSLLSTPIVLVWIPVCKSDIVSVLYQLIALDAILRWQRSSLARHLAVAGAAAGVSLGTKYNSVYVMPGLMLLIAYVAARSGRGPRSASRALTVFVGASTLLFSPWLLRNYLTTGNPVFPALAGMLGGGGSYEFTAEYQQVLSALFRQYGFRWGMDLWDLSLRTGYDTGPWVYLWLLPFALLYGRDVLSRRRNLHILVALVSLNFLAWLFTQMLWIRYNYFLYMLALVACALAVQRFTERSRARSAIALLFAVSVAVGTAGYAHRYFPAFLQYAVATVDEARFNRERTHYGEAVWWMNEHLPSDARIYTMVNQNYYAKHTYITMHAITEYGGFLLAESPDDFHRRLRETRIDFVAYHRFAGERVPGDDVLTAFLARISGYADALRGDGRLRPVAVVGKDARSVDVCLVPPVDPFAVTASARDVEFEAESFHRGTGAVSFAFAPRLGVVVSESDSQSSVVEYDLEVGEAGRYELRIRYAAGAARPVEVYLDGGLVEEWPAAATGGWFASSLGWSAPLTLELPTGRRVLRLEREGAFPHIERLQLRRVEPLDRVGVDGRTGQPGRRETRPSA